MWVCSHAPRFHCSPSNDLSGLNPALQCCDWEQNKTHHGLCRVRTGKQLLLAFITVYGLILKDISAYIMFTWTLQYSSLDFRDILGNIIHSTAESQHLAWSSQHFGARVTTSIFTNSFAHLGVWGGDLCLLVCVLWDGGMKPSVGKRPQQHRDITGHHWQWPQFNLFH